MDERKPIGVIGAMQEEVESLKTAMTQVRMESFAGMDFYAGLLGKKETVVVQCGMGKVNAAICAQLLITCFHAGSVINTGVAGSLDQRLKIGDLVIAEDAVQHDFDVSPIGFQSGEIPYTGRVAFPADKRLRSAALTAAQRVAPEAGILEGRICSGDQFLTTVMQKKSVTERYRGLCCEMEGAAIAQVCWLNGIPFAILRVISDQVDGSETTDFATFAVEAAERCARITRCMIESL